METRANHIIIGLFTLLVTAGAFLFVWWFGGNFEGSRVTYRVVFPDSIAGLTQGSTVLFNGLAVGEVTSLGLAMDDPGKMQATIAVQTQVPVRQDTKARLEYAGLTGVASVMLEGGKADSPALVAAADGGPPVIDAMPSEMQNLMDGARKMLTRADGILYQVETFVDESKPQLEASVANIRTFTEGLGALDPEKVKRIVDNAEAFSDALARNTENVDAMIADARVMIEQLKGASARVDSVLAKADTLLGSGENSGVFDEVKKTAEAMRVLAENLDKRTASLSSDMSQFTGKGLRDLSGLIASGRETLSNVDRVVRSLEANPQRFLFGGGGVPEYTPSR
jgi:phospholipid/cholesterol/gamma-HCH transport system substrate-binding protein